MGRPKKEQTKKDDFRDSLAEEMQDKVLYKVGVNCFTSEIYAEKFAARKGLKVEVLKP